MKPPKPAVSIEPASGSNAIPPVAGVCTEPVDVESREPVSSSKPSAVSSVSSAS